MAWGSLGDFVFNRLSGPSSESLKGGAVYAEHARIGRKATQQLTGIKLQETEWQVSFHHSIDPDITSTLEGIMNACEAGEILDLVIGDLPYSGIFAGQWVIHDYDVDSIARAPGGKIYSLELKLKLKEWVTKDGLEVSKRPPPPAVKTDPKKPKPPTGPGY
jgi:phage protein U